MKRARWLVAAAVAAAAATSFGGTAPAKSLLFDYFRMPSGNIHCGYVKVSDTPTYLRCEIRSRLKPVPPRPKACGDAVWAAGYSLTRFGRPYVLCITDTIFSPTSRVLTYGSTWKRDVFTCTSRSSGLRCVNGAAHGFFLSREHSYRF